MEPILHLSIPVRDLGEARAFYVEVLGCPPGRVREGWIDVWFHGMQVTLQERPDEVPAVDAAGVRHFGVTLGADELAALLARLDAHPVDWVAKAYDRLSGYAAGADQGEGARPERERDRAEVVRRSGRRVRACERSGLFVTSQCGVDPTTGRGGNAVTPQCLFQGGQRE